MDSQTLALAPGFDDPVHDGQEVFRAAMSALSRPGSIVPLETDLVPPAPLLPTAAALALMLVDFETRLLLCGSLAGSADVRRFLAFHTGAAITDAPDSADFALVPSLSALPPLGAFAQGTLDYPDRSTTLIIHVEGFDQSLVLEGPGINGAVAFGIPEAPEHLVADLTENRARFPLGVDLIFAAPHAIAALPRSTRIVKD